MKSMVREFGFDSLDDNLIKREREESFGDFGFRGLIDSGQREE